MMTNLLDRTGSVAGSAGVLVCVISAIARITGHHYLLAFELATLFLGGTALIAAGCLAKLQVLVNRLR